MSLFSQLEEKLKRSLLDRDSETTEILKLVKSTALLQAKDLNLETPTDEICQGVISKKIKTCRETIDLYQSRNLSEPAQQQQQEINVLQDLLPAQLGQSDLEKIVDETVASTGLGLEMGNFKNLLDAIEAKVGMSASRGQVAQLLKEKINSKDV